MNDLGFDLVNGATNHALDFDYPGALNSLAVWNEQENVVYTGIYERASRIAMKSGRLKGMASRSLS